MINLIIKVKIIIWVKIRINKILRKVRIKIKNKIPRNLKILTKITTQTQIIKIQLIILANKTIRILIKASIKLNLIQTKIKKKIKIIMKLTEIKLKTIQITSKSRKSKLRNI